MKHALAIAAPLLAASLAVTFNATQMLGAHPQWASTVLLIGAPGGLALGYVLYAIRLPYLLRVVLAFGIAGGAFYLAREGQAAFAASFAEDAAAGQQWFFGWIATCMGAAATLTTIFLRPEPKADLESQEE